MATTNDVSVKTPAEADLEYAIHLALAGQQDPAFAARIQAESARITEEIRQRHGLLDIGVPAIRELRGELPE
jgi:hypothetical protein